MPETNITQCKISCPIETAGKPFLEMTGTGAAARTYDLYIKSILGDNIIGTCTNLGGGAKRLNSELNKDYNGLNVNFYLKAQEHPLDISVDFPIHINDCRPDEIEKNPFPPFVAKGWNVPQANPFQ